MKTKSARRVNMSILLAILLVLVSVVSVFGQTPTLNLTPAGSVKQYSWDPSVGGGSPKWTNGSDPGYWEGETAAMAAEISKEVGVTYDLPICMQVWEEPLPTKAYGFTAFEPFNTTTRAPNLPPPALPGAEAITYSAGSPSNTEWDLSKSPIYGYNITINSVTPQTVGISAGCGANEIGVTVNYTPNTDQGAYIVWGGHIAKAGDSLPAGAPDATVPAGKSAGFVTGNFQARLKTSGADKTLPFTVTAGPNAVTLTDLAVKSAALPVSGVALIVLAALAGVVWTYRRVS